MRTCSARAGKAGSWVTVRGLHLKLALTRATADMGPMPNAPPVAACSVKRREAGAVIQVSVRV